jgi:Fic family protein
MRRYIHQLKQWPNFFWEHESIMHPLARLRHRQGKLLGKMEALGLRQRDEASVNTITWDVVKSSEIEGELLPTDQVRSSVARKLGVSMGGLVTSSRAVDGIVEMMLDATQHYSKKLTQQRLFRWHELLFPDSHTREVTVGNWRNDSTGPMQVVSGPMGRELVHFEAPAASLLKTEMGKFIAWFNAENELDPILKAAVAHLYFVTIHPFEDGNGRIARAIADMQLARADESTQRFYSMSSQIRKERNTYYDMLEKTQSGTLNVTEWLLWFMACLDRALDATQEMLQEVLQKTQFWEKHKHTAFNERQRKMLNKLMESFEGKLTSTKWAKMTKTSPDTALRDIQDLIDKGALKKDEGGGRNTSYLVRF